ncbi:hypothetical protein AV530_017051 [Patagioenas fasciata monilis]|uniref:Uncharacterized protein n=1 Tax=Patagioenas fasciata monilis TaxID=372326 RepID=A0A1V4J4I8_PATFA|nr:hypothetical protein AV530_017051 [Patagioenas fasciata monilis]
MKLLGRQRTLQHCCEIEKSNPTGILCKVCEIKVLLQRTWNLFLILFIQRSFGLKTEDSAVHFPPMMWLTKQ